MAKINWETGFKRIVWIVALLGAVGGLAISTYGVVTAITSTKELAHYKEVLERINAGDPDFLALNKSDQKSVIRTVSDKIEQYSRSDWKSQIYGGLGVGTGWFVLLWLVFFMTRWIIRGFAKGEQL